MSDRRYPARPIVGIGVCVLRGDEVLLVRRGRAPALGTWSLPGGAQELGETAEAAARRELAEETGVAVGALVLAAVIDSVHRDEAGAIAYHYTIIDYAARFEAGACVAGRDVSAAVWAQQDRLEEFGLNAQTLAVIAVARRLLG